ncbi:MAG: biotin--[acetyl-CoA-carboxylase] ligase [Cyanobacteria bacterium J06641_5]
MPPVSPPTPDRVDLVDCQPEGPQLPVYRCGRISSTNQVAWDLLAAGVGPPFAVAAWCQSAGRGQWGRTWMSEPGGLYVSTVLAVPPTVDRSQQTQSSPSRLPLTLAVAWGIASALRALAIPVQLKWPNDLFITNRKLGGVLCQQRQRGPQPYPTTVVGVGINWANAVPPGAIALEPWLQQHRPNDEGTNPGITSLDGLLQLVQRGIYRGHNQFWDGDANYLLDSYEKLLTSLKQPVTIGEHTGIVRGVAPDGRLRIGFPDTEAEIL